MSERMENLGLRETYRQQRKKLVAEILSHRDSIRVALPLTGEPESIDGEYVAFLGVKLNELLLELAGVNYKISVLSQELD